jgi:hypothetical protein
MLRGSVDVCCVERIAREKRPEVVAHCHRANSWSATTVRNAERLMQVQVAHVCAEEAWFGYSNEGVQVCTVHVHLATVFVDDIADLSDSRLEHAVRRGIRNHESGESVGRLCALGAQVGEVDVSFMVACHDNDIHSCHHRTCRVGSVSTRRNETHDPLVVATAVVVCTNCKKPSELALTASIRLQADRVVASD